MTPLTWVVGASGLLGHAVVAEARASGHETMQCTVPWDDPDASVAALVAGAESMLSRAARRPWRLVWAAGAGVVATGKPQLDQEAECFEGFMSWLTERLGVDDAMNGSMFLASSAGGVYAGSAGPPFTEESVPVPMSHYGHTKLRLESAAADLCSRTGAQVVCGRIANLYGPGQDLHKAQGLISQLAKASLTRQPITLYAPLDTLRDYLYVQDCAQMTVAALDRPRPAPDRVGGRVVTKIFASGRPTTIAAVLGTFSRTLKRRAPVVIAPPSAAAFQVRDLRLRSTVWPELDRLAATPLPVGMMATIEDVADRLHRADAQR